MQFDPDNSVIKLCTEGMNIESKGLAKEASELFLQAWNEAINDFEKFTAAHYGARHQKTVADKLKWDETALHLALKINDETIKASYSSLYLNIAKCYEDLNNYDRAKKNYQLALSFTSFLPDNGYGNMVKEGITRGIERVK
jgi:tetratricopeptide (TPR) repeat protein